MGSVNEDVRKKFQNEDFENTIVMYCNNRFLASEQSMATNISVWEQNRKLYDAEITLKPEDVSRRNEEADNPVYVPLRIPYTYAAVQTYLTYLLALFTKRRPMFQLDGRRKEDMEAVPIMENILHNNAINRGFLIPIHTWLRDSLIYNRGIIWRDWYVQKSKSLRQEQPMLLGKPVGSPKEFLVERVEDEGNDLFTSSPFDTYFDPGVIMQQFEEGEFVGRVYYQTWTTILTKMKSGEYWDVRSKIPQTTTLAWKNRTAPDRPGDKESQIAGRRTSVEICDLLIRLVPKEWKLGDSIFPEYWRIRIANGKTVLNAERLPNLYEFPCYVVEPDFDGRTLHTKGMVQMMEPLQEVLSWLINSHMDSVRRNINNKFIIDPSLVEWDDVLNNAPYVRMSQRGYGRNPGTAIYQLKMSDVTQTHLKDIDIVIELLTRISAATENFMGVLNTGGRKTATEVRTANQLAGSRIEKTALIIGHQGWIPLTRGLVNGVQNNMSNELFIRDFSSQDPDARMHIDEKGIERLKNSIFAFPPIDPTIPVDRFQLAETWKEIIQFTASNEGLAQEYDIKGMLNHWAELGGIKDLENFKVVPQIQAGGPDVQGVRVPFQTGTANPQL